jgi:chromosome segregation ATPase
MTTRPKPRSVLSLAITGLLFTSIACSDSDERKVDRQVHEMMQASEKARRNPTTQNLNNSLAELVKAAGQSGASVNTRIKAKSAVAQGYFEAGQRTARELVALRPNINRAMWDISTTADQITFLNSSAKAAAQTNPQPTLKAVADKRAEMVAAGEAATRKTAEIQGEIDKIKGQINTLTEQKNAATTEADADADKATKLADKEADPILEKVVETRRKAANLGHEIDKLTALLFPLERDLAVEQGKKKTADEGAAALDQQRQRFEGNWQAMQQKVAEQNGVVQRLGTELDQKAQELAALVKQADELRTKAIDQFQRSADHYAAAAKDAADLSRELKTWSRDPKFATAPEKKAWEDLEKVNNSNVFKLYDAESRCALGDVHIAHVSQLQNMEKLAAAIAPALQDARHALPPTLPASLKEQIDAAKAAADKQYTDAAEKFVNVYGVSTNPKDVNYAAHIARIFALYGQYLNGDKGKLADAKTEAQQTFADEHSTDPLIKALPAELRADLAAPTPPTPPGRG